MCKQKHRQEGTMTAEEIALAYEQVRCEIYLSDPIAIKALDSIIDTVAALREKLSAYESGGHTLVPTTELSALREELEKVKRERNRALDDFASLQFSSVQAARKNLKELEAIKDQLSNERHRHKAEKETRIDYQKQLSSTEKYAVKLKEELEAVTKERDGLRIDLKVTDEALSKSIAQQDEVTRQRDEVEAKLIESRAACMNIAAQRDEAIGLLQRVRPAENEWNLAFGIEVDLFLSRLSSGDTNHPEIPECSKSEMVSPWISVDERFPEIGQNVAFIRHGAICGGKYLGDDFEKNYFSTIGYGTSASHWMPLPDPPGSLTDENTKLFGCCVDSCVWEKTEQGARCKKCGTTTPF